MFRGPLFIGKKHLRAAKYKKSPKNELNLIKKYNLVSFWDVGGPHIYIWRATCSVFETPVLDPPSFLLEVYV
jgi:hypothetical protein